MHNKDFETVGVITYPWPNTNAGLANLSRQKRPQVSLTHLPLVPYKCVSESGQHWFR